MTTTMSRRTFVLASAALPLGCAAGRGPAAGEPVAVRPPMVGQSWRYAKHDFFTKALVDTEQDAVISVGDTVEISGGTEGVKTGQPDSAGSMAWLRKYFVHPKGPRTLPSEIQAPWGMVLVDPHWSQVQIYDAPIPLWPARLEVGWRTHFIARYKTSDQSDLPWDQTMKAEAWETVSVPAGRFRTLRYVNSINFTSSDLSRANSVRHETIWFAPEIGRWVARESHGTYYFDESTADDQNQESSFRWELLGFT